MLDKKFIKDYITQNNIPDRPRRNLVEYLQTEILFSLYNSKYSKALTFMGGTCLRFVYKVDRFSEDLDFELLDKNLDYNKLADFLNKSLKKLGFVVETRVKGTKNITIIFIKFSEIMRQMGLSSLVNQKIKIKFEIDPNPSKFIQYDSAQVFSFGKIFYVIANNLETIFAQKVMALFHRPYQKGRDFYDLIWFLSQKKIEPNYKILQEKGHKIKNRQELVKEMKKVITDRNLEQAVKDTKPFLFHPEQAEWILDFEKHLDEFLKV
ncbi:MAG: nucleotidyl transferase AbiEii/AbiGii toxin family protein [Patescibacteria group bacterium]|nr:nucleotidyl transferase AbiEii/AbiGii toxin family protein [Patescibacteria group bacterium]